MRPPPWACSAAPERAADLIIGKEAAVEHVVLGAPLEERLGADGVVAQGGRSVPLLLAADDVAVEVALAEGDERDAVLGALVAQPAELAAVVLDGLGGRGGLLVEEELVEGLLPGGIRRSLVHLRRACFAVSGVVVTGATSAIN